MKKGIKRIGFCILIAILVWTAELVADRHVLRDSLIRFHVVANSDSKEDQNVKLLVRDAVLEAIQDDLRDIADVDTAKGYLQENLPKIERIANETLKAAGMEEGAVALLQKETFDARKYDTFSLPAGVYDSLRIVIGSGAGHNWWCVAFPTLCMSTAVEDFEDQAVGAGFSETLTQTLSGQSEYKIRFFLLDALGKLENILFRKEIIPCSLDGICAIM